MKDSEEYLDILRKINNKPNISQRKLASELNLSLGKLNYCLKALRNKGLVKIKNFEANPKKLKYVYILTPKGIKKKLFLQ